MSSQSTTPDISEKTWTNPFSKGTPLYDLYADVVSEHRDLVIIVDDYMARRGTGKTVMSLQLANGMDQTEAGMTHEKATLQPEEIVSAYANLPKRSGLVLDEGELGASNRQAMSNVNQALREIMSIGRVKEKYVVVNAPLKKFIDSDIRKLADVWISMTRKGLGLVHFFEWEQYSEQLLTPQKQWFECKDIPPNTQLREVYNRLTREKERYIEGDTGDNYILESEHEEELERVRKNTRKKTRDQIIKSLFEHPEIQQIPLSQRMVGDAVGLTQQQVSLILNNE